MKLSEVLGKVIPFEAWSIHDGHKVTVISQSLDPLRVGVQVVNFREGGWLMFSDFIKNFSITKSKDNSKSDWHSPRYPAESSYDCDVVSGPCSCGATH